MTSKKVAQPLIDLGVIRSRSRPKVSNDNPYSGAQFETTEHTSDYPERFDALAQARERFDAFISHCRVAEGSLTPRLSQIRA